MEEAKRKWKKNMEVYRVMMAVPACFCLAPAVGARSDILVDGMLMMHIAYNMSWLEIETLASS